MYVYYTIKYVFLSWPAGQSEFISFFRRLIIIFYLIAVQLFYSDYWYWVSMLFFMFINTGWAVGILHHSGSRSYYYYITIGQWISKIKLCKNFYTFGKTKKYNTHLHHNVWIIFFFFFVFNKSDIFHSVIDQTIIYYRYERQTRHSRSIRKVIIIIIISFFSTQVYSNFQKF